VGTLAGHGEGRSLSNRHATSRSISAWVKAVSNKEFISSTVIERENEYLIRSRFTARMDQPQAFESQFLTTSKGANLTMGKFLITMTRLEIGVMEFSYPPDQSGQVPCHLQLSPLIIEERWEQMPVQPLRLDMHID
jgi:hypothetical protein